MIRFATLAPIVLTAALFPPGDEVLAPPGLVLIKGGRTQVGADPDEVIPIIEKTGIKKLVGETPEHSVRLDDFLLMRTEVTNEQYLAYVEATGAPPPRSWAEAAVNAAIEDFNKKEGPRIEELKAQGLPWERQKFDSARQAKWWKDNWQDQEWALPPGLEDHPVFYVTFEEAQAYARWAGLRLMTEEEFQRAGRGDSDRTYVWGDDFDMEKCATVERKFQSTSPVGSFPKGASPDGVYDLCGNVWEWTASKYVAFPGYKPLTIQFDGRQETALAEWDANQRVAVSACYKSPKEAARLTTRRASDRFQSTDSLGFRCAGTPTAGFDLAQNIVEQDISVYVVPQGVTFEPQIAVAMDRWESLGGSAKVEGYRVITAYHNVLFLPVSGIEAGGLKPLLERSHAEGPVLVGVFSTSVPFEKPKLAPGTYLVAWRGRGGKDEEPDEKPDENSEETSDDEPAAEAEAEVLDWDPKEDCYVFYDLEGKPVTYGKDAKITNERLKLGEIVARVMQPSEEQRQYGIEPWDQINFKIPVPGQRSSSREFVLRLELEAKEGTLTGNDWRRTGK